MIRTRVSCVWPVMALKTNAAVESLIGAKDDARPCHVKQAAASQLDMCRVSYCFCKHKGRKRACYEKYMVLQSKSLEQIALKLLSGAGGFEWHVTGKAAVRCASG